MRGAPVFLDTVSLVALVRSHDSLHSETMEVMKGLAVERAPLVTSQWVLAEFMGNVADPSARHRGAALARALASSVGTVIIAADAAGYARALDLYEGRPDKGWSFVDCSSMCICEDRNIRRVFTHDKHFAQAGFEVLLGGR